MNEGQRETINVLYNTSTCVNALVDRHELSVLLLALMWCLSSIDQLWFPSSKRQEDNKASRRGHKDTWGAHPVAAAHRVVWHGISSYHQHAVYLAPTPLLSRVSVINFPAHPPTNTLEHISLSCFLSHFFANCFCFKPARHTSINYSLHSTMLDKQGKSKMATLPLINVVFPFLSNLPTI
jgi:hypothetical protein